MSPVKPAAGPLPVTTMDRPTAHFETDVQLSSSLSLRRDGLARLYTLPTEIFDQVFSYLEVSDHLVLRLLSRNTYISIPRPGLLYRHEIAPVARLLKRDRFNKACQTYRACPDPQVLPCARCMMFHTLDLFFDAQIGQRHEERSCKGAGVITACACGPITWETLASTVSARRHTGQWYNTHCTCSPETIVLAYTSVQRYLPRFSWQLPFRTTRLRERGCVQPTPYSTETMEITEQSGIGLTLWQSYKWPGVDIAETLRDPDRAAPILRQAAFPICPHIATDHGTIYKMLRHLKAAKWNKKILASTRYCKVKDCQTRFTLYSDTSPHIWDRDGFLTVSKDLGRIHKQTGPLHNKAFLAQAIMPPSGSKICLTEEDWCFRS